MSKGGSNQASASPAVPACLQRLSVGVGFTLLVGATTACGGGTSDHSQTAGSGGTVSGSAGVAGASGGASGGVSSVGGSSGGVQSSGGEAGTSSEGGSAGVAGSVGTGGAAGEGGAGAGGTAGVAQGSCTTAEDCLLVDGCCDCLAWPRSTPTPQCDIQTCLVNACGPLNITADDVQCVAGRCSFARSCDQTEVTCRQATPDCPAGTQPQVEGSCYAGGCLPVDQCARVTSCEVCSAAGLECATYTTQLGPQYHCVSVLDHCQATDCECMGVCTQPFTCGQGLSCDCIVC